MDAPSNSHHSKYTDTTMLNGPSRLSKGTHCHTLWHSQFFPQQQMDPLIPKTLFTLNLLCQSNVAPKISTYTYHHSTLKFGRIPLVPLGCALQFHIKPNCHQTCGEHSMDGWYIGASPEYYCTHLMFVKGTCTTCLSETVFFKQKYIM